MAKKEKDLEDKALSFMEAMYRLHVIFSKKKFSPKKTLIYSFEEVSGLRDYPLSQVSELRDKVEAAYQSLILLADARMKQGFDECQEYAIKFRTQLTSARDLYDELNKKDCEDDRSDDELKEDSSDPS
jgi:hypothetical protein